MVAHGQRLEFSTLSLADGLPSEFVVSILQDSEGYLWIGTADGLSRFDGYDFEVFRHDKSDSSSISDSFVGYNTLIEDRRGDLWIGTRNGLSRWNRRSGAFTQFYSSDSLNGLTSNRIRAVYESQAGDIWIGTDKGVNRYNVESGSFTSYRCSSNGLGGLNSDKVFSIIEDAEGIIWAGTAEGLNKFVHAEDRFQPIVINERELNSIEVSSLELGKSGRLWLGTKKHGLLWYDIPSKTHGRLVLSDSLVSVNTLHYHDHTLWIGSASQGLFKYDTQLDILDRYVHDPINPFSIANNLIRSIHVDDSGLLWVGSWDGLSIGKVNPFSRFPDFYAGGRLLLNKEVQAIFEDSKRDIWLGLEKGELLRITVEEQRVESLDDSPYQALNAIDKTVYSISLDAQQNMWLATAGDGVYRLNPNTGDLDHFYHKPGDSKSLSSNNVYQVYEDKNHDIWISTADQGLNRFNRSSSTFENLRHNPGNSQSLSYNSVWPLFEDDKGRFWVGSFGGGLNEFHRGSQAFTHYRQQDTKNKSISNDRVVSINQVQDGSLWIGTMGGGMNRFDTEEGSFTFWSTEEGMPSGNVVCALEGDDGLMWLGTSSGLVRLNPDSQEVAVFNTHHGLPSASFSYGSCLKASDGTLYYGTDKGVVAFRPEDIPGGDAPEIVIRSVEVFGERVPVEQSPDQEERLMLNHDENFLTIRFAALDFKASGMNQYSYFLEGYDKQWESPGHRLEARYTGCLQEIICSV